MIMFFVHNSYEKWLSYARSCRQLDDPFGFESDIIFWMKSFEEDERYRYYFEINCVNYKGLTNENKECGKTQ